eukprot:SAG31_NODE_485_length_15021_cov_9.439791_9_plen_84_part_00
MSQNISKCLSKPSVDWHQNPTDPSLNYLFITGHYIEVDPDMPGDEDGEGIKAFHFEQVRVGPFRAVRCPAMYSEPGHQIPYDF